MNEALQSIKGIGPNRERQFHKLGIQNVSSLLTYFPRDYEVRTILCPINKLEEGTFASLLGKVIRVDVKRPRPRLSIVEVYVEDGTGRLKLVFFNQTYKKNFYKVGQQIHIYGKAEIQYGMWQMNSPQTELVLDGKPLEMGIIPVYPLKEGMHQYVVRQAIEQWFLENTILEPVLPKSIAKQHNFMSRYEAFKEMHFPTSMNAYKVARSQLAYEELFIMQIGLLLLRREMRLQKGYPMRGEDTLMGPCIHNLPFDLTSDQKKALEEIKSDMEQETPMQRLVQGDVGSGKTVVAVLALLKAVQSGFQGALMAPTEILATQHYESIQELCKNLPITATLLTGSMKESEKKRVYEAIEKGHVDIVIGTHALIQGKVHFKSLGLVIIDEQHRFGVEQRAKLQRKGMFPHMLIMTATPIPRTLTLSMYGDLEVSLIKEMPPGRKPVKTYVVDSSYKERLYRFFEKEMNAGHQIYVVCPLVEESEALDLQAAQDLFIELEEYYGTRHKVGLVHGKMRGPDKEAVMTAYQEGRIHLLVSTTVIEVGVNVPNATVMCVEGAERFGLSQLHQLRGRVGRGQTQSYCILVSDSKNSKSKTRLQLMEAIQDGFELAEEDLLLRGSGQLFGLSQSGLPDLRVAHIIKDLPILVSARNDAKEYLERVEEIDAVLLEEIKQRFGPQFLRILYS